MDASGGPERAQQQPGSASGAQAARRFPTGPLPTSLYVHWPWCLRKCPYCDFNSHAREGALPQAAYVDALLADLDAECRLQALAAPLLSVFIGGGTPSLIEVAELDRLISVLRARAMLAEDVEITLEANPGAADARSFAGYLRAGVNRLSLGVQSLSAEHLDALGRVHDPRQARLAVAAARQAGCRNLNIDMMFGLPGQSLAEALRDLDRALALEPEHLSYYQLTLEPGTAFAAAPPVLPHEDVLADMADAGIALLERRGYQRYEISAYARAGRRCRHNLNYWEFGDYLGIGAGAHGKRTEVATGRVRRRVKPADPADYLRAFPAQPRAPSADAVHEIVCEDAELIAEFALNVLRLCDGVPSGLFAARTGLAPGELDAARSCGCALGLLDPDSARLKPTPEGLRWLDRLLECFVPG